MTTYAEDTGIYQQIYESLLVGDYVEVKGICVGKNVLVEMLTEAAAPKANSIVPLRIHMTENGPVTVSSLSPGKHQKQEKVVPAPVQQNSNFILCILAMEHAFKITLNRETVCTHDYIVDLDAIQAIGVDGDAIFTDIEFKDTHSEEDGDRPESETPVGFIRMQELRESSMRKKGGPVYISTSSPRQYASPPPLSTTPSGAFVAPNKQPLSTYTPTKANDLTVYQPATPADTDYVVTRVSKSGKDIAFFPGLRNSTETPTDNGRGSLSEPNIYQPQDTDYVTTRVSKSGKGLAFFPGRRKSSTLDHNGSPSTLTGLPGVYRQLDDEELTRRYQADSRNSSTPSVHDRKSNRKSWFGSKGKTSKSYESDLQYTNSIGKEGKSKKTGLFGRSKKGSTPPSQSVDSLNTLSRETMNSDVTLRRGQGTDSGRPLYLGAATERDRVKGTLSKSVAGGTAPEMAGYIASQRALPEFENFTLIPYTAEPRSEYRTSRQSRPVSSQYINQPLESPRVIPTSYVPRDSYLPRDPATRSSRPISIDAKYNTSTYQEPIREAPRVSTYRESAYTIPRTVPSNRQTDYYVKDPPKTAAILYEKQPDRNIAISDGSLIDIERYKPEPVYQRPKIDVDVRPISPIAPAPVQTQKVYSMPEIAVIDQVPISTPAYNAHRRNSVASIDGLDKGFYLVVGNTTYYQERLQSLKRHRSSRSLRRENGPSYHNSSRASSVSSFRINEISSNYPVKSGHTAKDINSWLKTQPQEADIYPTSATHRMQYAAPPANRSGLDESPDTNAVLPLPANLKFPEENTALVGSVLKMKTGFTVDSKVARLTLNLNTGEQWQIVIDFIEDRIYLKEGEEQADIVDVIPYIPEQVREIHVNADREEDLLKLYVNRVELCSFPMTKKWPLSVDVAGDFALKRVWCE